MHYKHFNKYHYGKSKCNESLCGLRKERGNE